MRSCQSMLSSFAVLAACVSPASVQQCAAVQVFVLAGQSNMVGHGVVAADPARNGGAGSLESLVTASRSHDDYVHLVDADGEWVARDDVWISFFDREGPLTVGYGASEQRIGPELGFGTVVGDAFEQPVLLIKVAWGGKSLARDFRPPSAGGQVGACYRELFAHVRLVLDEVDQRFPALAGRGYEIAGIGWHQGWNDRINQEFNDAYEDNLACFIRDARRELGRANLPFVVAETGMSGPQEKHPRALSLMRAQAAVAAREQFRGTVAFVGTKHCFRPKQQSPSGQAYHWNSNAESYYLIGKGMGEAMLELHARTHSASEW